MKKFIKYEIKGSYKFILAVVTLTIILTIANFGILKKNMYNSMSDFDGLFIGISFMVIFGIMLGTFFYIVNLFRKELYEDRGYLTFTLPISGKQIVGSKLLVAFFWYFIISVVFILVNVIGGISLIPKEILSEVMAQIKSNLSLIGGIDITDILAAIISFVGSIATTLLLVYFSMALGRVSIKNRKMKGIWFIIFIILSLLISFVQYKVIKAVPYYMNFSKFGIESRANLINVMDFGAGSISMGFDMYSGALTNTMNDVLINIGYLFYNIAVLVGLFFGTSYLIEKKIDI